MQRTRLAGVLLAGSLFITLLLICIGYLFDLLGVNVAGCLFLLVTLLFLVSQTEN